MYMHLRFLQEDFKVKSKHKFSYFLVLVLLRAYILKITQCLVVGKMDTFEFHT